MIYSSLLYENHENHHYFITTFHDPHNHQYLHLDLLQEAGQRSSRRPTWVSQGGEQHNNHISRFRIGIKIIKLIKIINIIIFIIIVIIIIIVQFIIIILVIVIIIIVNILKVVRRWSYKVKARWQQGPEGASR